jgi:hypothetical protein
MQQLFYSPFLKISGMGRDLLWSFLFLGWLFGEIKMGPGNFGVVSDHMINL